MKTPIIITMATRRNTRIEKRAGIMSTLVNVGAGAIVGGGIGAASASLIGSKKEEEERKNMINRYAKIGLGAGAGVGLLGGTSGAAAGALSGGLVGAGTGLVLGAGKDKQERGDLLRKSTGIGIGSGAGIGALSDALGNYRVNKAIKDWQQFSGCVIV